MGIYKLRKEMKFLLLLVALVCVSSSSVPDYAGYTFERFVAEHTKVYATEVGVHDVFNSVFTVT